MRSFEERLSNQLEATASLATLIQPSTDQLRLDKLDKFATKLLKREFTIAFAGHFSAGKSSMINALTGESVLPTSPIPTSANIVTLQQGEMDSAIVHFHEQPSVRLTATEQEEHLQSLGKSGDVRQIDLTHAASALPPGLVLMDTPGVDSVDDAHRVSTESALHLADILFYVMDYNHVQSELNFMVTDELQAAVPELYLIVNQIDKHRNDELSFDAFRRSVHASFAEHGVVPKGIFFTSLRDPAHPHNDFTEVEQLVKQSIRDAQPKLLTSAALTLESLHQEHTRYLTRLVSESHETMAEQLNDTERRDPAKIETELARVSQQLEARQPDRWVQTFSLHRDQLLKNATLMPFELREKMRRFLESRQRDFKVGLFRSA
ncbi:MAG: dynamin family protein, partial [Exiguobacterium indicum]